MLLRDGAHWRSLVTIYVGVAFLSVTFLYGMRVAGKIESPRSDEETLVMVKKGTLTIVALMIVSFAVGIGMQNFLY
ncbi:MAG: hypothetical protein LBJ20_06275 [Candidatus Methanoplasma sp.]|nr:hypothetical protein [Candidatus Methanoplasma sp.]